MNKVVYILFLLVIIGCGSSKSKLQSKKTVQTTHKKKGVTPPAKKVVNEQPVVQIDQPKTQNEILVATSNIKVTKEVVLAYINDFKDVAKEDMQKYGVPASITLAQGILESGAGTGVLCRTANNHFGIKCHKEWTGEYVRHDDDAAQECFRKYEKAYESYRDHSLFLTTRPWYQPLFKLEKHDYKGWARGLKKSGYATDPKYPEKLIGLIERYNLHQYDAEVLGIDFFPIMSSPVSTPSKLQSEIKLASMDQTHVVEQGDTLYSISRKYNLSVDSLKVKNNLTDNAISIGQTLIVK
ncbi:MULTISPECIES: glucosaminidase domain-containing protein [Flavobacterium]|uniref:Peptidoglycan hydrolase n=1 Tax=Flavobacterium hankyongi TaxID=1176532 RepID=A0ABP8ZTV8_9FLAO|nr:glucosaminidase domain-containing protein [Flavobacterium sp. N1846]